MCKFDVVLGNPPYQEEVRGLNRTYKRAMYDKFLDLGEELGAQSIFIHPARCLFNTGSTDAKWNQKLLKSPHYKVLFYEVNSGAVFPGTSIKGGVAVTYHTSEKTFSPIDVFSSHKELNTILNKVRAVEGDDFANMGSIMHKQTKLYREKVWSDFPEIKERARSLDRRLITSAFSDYPELFSMIKEGEEYIGIFGREKQARTCKWLKEEYVEDNGNLYKYKVLIPAANGCANIGEGRPTPVMGKPLLVNPREGHTQTFVSFGAFDSLDEAQSLLKYVQTKFARTMLGLKKVTQDNKKSDTWAKVPLQDFTSQSDIDWSQSVSNIDHQLYMKYGLSEEEISFIEEKVQPMDVDNQDIDDREV